MADDDRLKHARSVTVKSELSETKTTI